MLLEADRGTKALKEAPASIPKLVEAYTDGDRPWCLLDSHHRHLEVRWFNFEPEQGGPPGSPGKLVKRAEERYTKVGSELARAFVACYAKAKHPIPGVLRQVQIFESQVRPRLTERKVADVWVDALRYEMARELADVLEADFDLTLSPALGTAPTITKIGMAALLPRADQGVKVVPVGLGKLGLQIERTVIKDRKDRIAFLKAHAGVPVLDAKLEDLPYPGQPRRYATASRGQGWS